MKLTDVTLVDVGNTSIQATCFLGTNDYSLSLSSNNCIFLQILGGLTIGVGLLIAIIQCYTCNLCGLGGLLDGLFALAGSAAWGAASAVITEALNGSNLPGGDLNPSDISNLNHYRSVTQIMCWVEFGLFCFVLLSCLLKCCPGRRK